MIILKIIGTIFVVCSMLAFEGFKIADSNFQPPIYQTILYHICAVITMLSVWS